MSGNSPAEQHEKNYRIALKQLKNSHKLCIWYLKLNKKYTQDIPDFIEPVKPISVTVQESAVELKQLDDNYQALLSEIQKIQEQPKDTDKINKTILIAQNKAEEIKLESGEFETQSSNINLLPIGTILNNQYKIIEILSAGSFGQTYLANDTNSFDEKVVVKQFRPQSSDEETIKSAKSLFKREAQTLYKLNKIDSIPNLKAFFEEDNQFYLVQEFIDGNTLEEEILLENNGNKFSESRVTKLLQDILTSLNNLHSLSVIHRDIKPSNLIRNIDNKKIYLIDFGAVKQIVNNSTDGTIIIGTKGYMPFEQLQGQPQLNSDIYAVGMIVIQAATGLKISKINEGQWQVEAKHLSDHLICILEKMTAIDYKNRYRYVQEILDDLKIRKSTNVSSEPITSAVVSPITEIKYTSQPINNINTAKSKLLKPSLGLTIAGVVVGIAVLGFFIKSIPYFTKAKISIDTITIGTLEEPKRYTELRKHLETELIPSNFIDYIRGKKITVNINGDKTLSYQEAQQRITDKQWDVAFTLSPIISIHAKKQGYKYIASMFPDKPFYEAGIIVHKSSPIQSLDDIKPSTTIALGNFNSASSFYLPIYDLYGKTISVSTGHKGAKIRDMVINKEVDIGSAAMGDIINNKFPDLRLVGISRKIPGSGVYISPNLSENDQNSIKKVMLYASKKIKSYEQANYGDKSKDEQPVFEPDYTEFEKLMERVDSLLVCSDFSKNPVKLYCPEGFTPYEIIGIVNGSSIKGNNYTLKVTGQDFNIYIVNLDKKVFNELTNNGQLNALQGKKINIKITTNPHQTNQGLSIDITQIQQVKIIN
ncbi:protein kinase domain-containing protein [Planktothrix paucivesiculata]|uniref:non-specific serine/threonine protein kinase n=1 Tax=Planktothrix paucivesiculata PCC 9631 TaxID=671071 RepID=A0A7Z9E3J7_9CYAN|nr:protein kinase [Planktothrix paucivesiculata]VXD21611.1 putative Serine/threonine protein kinase [Planktothrix paucivesiculata PCC 9631]